MENNPIARGTELDVRHETPHQHDSPSAWGFQVGRIGGIGHLGRVKSFPFIGDLDPESFGKEPAGDVDLLGAVATIAVLDRVDQGFLHREPDAEHVALAPAVTLELFEDLLLDPGAGTESAGDDAITLPNRLLFGHRRGLYRGMMESCTTASRKPPGRRPPLS